MASLDDLKLNVSVKGNFAYGRMIKDEFMVTLLASELSERQLKLITNSTHYANSEYQGGLPGHELMLTIAKLMEIMQIDNSLVLKALQEIEADESCDCYWGCDCKPSLCKICGLSEIDCECCW